MKIGRDKHGTYLQLGDICKFTINKEAYEGMIVYDEEFYSFCFEMLTDNFPEVFMNKADLGSIEKIISVWSTNINDETYAKYQKLAKELNFKF